MRLFGTADVTEADLGLPLYNADDEEAPGILVAVQRLVDAIEAADAVIIATPEYNKSPPGTLKNALDWVSRTKGRPFRDKPAVIMSATGMRVGGERTRYATRRTQGRLAPVSSPAPKCCGA